MNPNNIDGENVTIVDEKPRLKSEPAGLDREGNFAQIPNRLFKDIARRKLHPIDSSVYAAYSTRLGENEAAWPSNKTIATTLNVSVRTIIDANNRLIACGYMERATKSKRGTKNTRLLILVKGKKVVTLLKTPLRKKEQRCSLDQLIDKVTTDLGDDITNENSSIEDADQDAETAWELTTQRATQCEEEMGVTTNRVEKIENNCEAEEKIPLF